MMDAAEIQAEDEGKKKPVKAAAKKTAAKAAKPAKEPVAEVREVVETAVKPKAAKAPAKGKTAKAAKSDSNEGELLFSSDRDDTPEPAAKPISEARQPSVEKAEKPAPAVERPMFVPPTFKIVGEEPAEKSGDSGKRHEAVDFDPGAIFARFAPKPGEAKPETAVRPENNFEAKREAKREARETRESNEAGNTGEADEGVRAPAAGEAARAPGEESGVSGEAPRAPGAPGAGEGRPQQNQQPQQGRDRQQGGQQGRQQQGGQQGRHPNDRQQNGGNGQRHPNDRQGQPQQGGRQNDPRNQKFQQQRKQWPGLADTDTAEEHELALGEVFNYNSLNDPAVLEEQEKMLAGEDVGEAFDFNTLYASSMNDIVAAARNMGLKLHRTPQRRELTGLILEEAGNRKRPIKITGTLELLEDGNGLLVYGFDNYRVRELSAFIPKILIKKCGLLRGHEVEALAFPARAGETAPMVVKVLSVMGAPAEEVMQRTPFTELTAYYPTRRMMLETENTVGWDNLSMRCVDLLCPVGLGQRGLIVAPPRTGKTVLMQAIANSIARNNPEVHLMVLLVDERPEEVTDFRRNSKANEIVSSTFDENAESHVHAAEMVIERARRMVEGGRHVVILLDSITRLARAYNTMVPSSGKILSGGIEAGALTRPKRFFGSARNIEGGGSLTILGTALVDTGSKMDEVIFEEFKGTGNMELDLDRDLANKRIFPAINFERSGTRKEELLYHPDEMAKIYALRRAMKGVPSVEAMEMLINRVKKTKTNAEFLLTLSR